MTKPTRYIIIGILIGANITAGLLALIFYACGRQWLIDLVR